VSSNDDYAAYWIVNRFRCISNRRFPLPLLLLSYWTRGLAAMPSGGGAMRRDGACDAVVGIVDDDFVDFDVFSCDD
jgi:hypothetical protein